MSPGHSHGYERTFSIYNYSQDRCGYVHAQIGGGGQDAKQDYVDGPLRPPYCSNASSFYVSPDLWWEALWQRRFPESDRFHTLIFSIPAGTQLTRWWRTPPMTRAGSRRRSWCGLRQLCFVSEHCNTLAVLPPNAARLPRQAARVVGHPYTKLCVHHDRERNDGPMVRDALDGPNARAPC